MKHDSSVKERSLNPAPVARPAASKPAETAVAELDDRIKLALHAISDKKALDTVVLDLREIASFTDYFVITSGMNERQVQAVADEVSEKLKRAGSPVARIEGHKTAEWILLDYGDFVVHVFDDKSRKFYDLERLWREAKRVALPSELAQENASSRD